MPTLYQYAMLPVLLIALVVMLKTAIKCWKDFSPKEDK